MTWLRTGFWLVSALLLAGLAEATPNPRVMEYLRAHPTDRPRVTELLKKCLSAKNYEDGYVVARYLNRYLGVATFKLYQILGICALKNGDQAKARSYSEEALKLNPAAPTALKVVAFLDRYRHRDSATAGSLVAPSEKELPPPDTAPSVAASPAPTPPVPDPAGAAASVSGSPEYMQAYHYFFEDRYDRAMLAIEAAVARNPKDVDALILKSEIHAARLEHDKAQQILTDLSSTSPEDPRVFNQLGDFSQTMATTKKRPELLQAALGYYTRALKLKPDHVPSLLSMASLMQSLHEKERSDELYAKAALHKPFRDRHLVLTDAQIQYQGGHLEEALKLMEQYSTTFGSDSQSMLQEGLVLLKLGRKEEAGESLEQSFRRNPQNLNAIMTIVPLLVTMDQAGRAFKVITAAEGEYPGVKSITAMKDEIRLRIISDKDMVTKHWSHFTYTFPSWLESYEGKPINTILRAFEESYNTVTTLFDERPENIKLKIHLNTGLDNPAFYDAEADAITIAAFFFCDPEKVYKGSRRRVDPDKARRFAAHMARHEFVHLVFIHKLGQENRKRAAECIPLWLQEGMAEWGAGGTLRPPDNTESMKDLFSDGIILNCTQMTTNMQVVNGSKSERLNHKAYAQGFFIAKYLMNLGGGQSKGLAKFMDFCRALIRADGDLDPALKSIYNLSNKEFNDGWRDYLKKELINAPVPNLTSYPGSAEDRSADVELGVALGR